MNKSELLVSNCSSYKSCILIMHVYYMHASRRHRLPRQADIAKQDGKPARKIKEAPVPKGRKVTSMGDSGAAKKEGKALASAGKSLLKSAVGGDDKDKRRLKVDMEGKVCHS